MTRITIVLLGTLCLLACDRSGQKSGATTTTGATEPQQGATTQGGSGQQGQSGQMQGGQGGQAGQAGQTGQTGQTGQAGQGGSMQGGMAGQTGQAGQGGSMGSGQTKNTEAVRNRLMQDKAAPASVITALTITDDGSLVVVSGTVPDQVTHDNVLKSAQKAPGVKGIRDDMKIKGQ
jgi:osmotically-inducible protein OsmY